MTISQLKILAALEENGNFTEVAERLGITQSAVSHSLAGLESELGVTLIGRDRKGGVPTEAGKRVLMHAREILARLELIREEVSALGGLRIGKVRIGSLQSVARILPEVVVRFRQKYPGIEVSVFEGSDQEILDWIRAGTIDLGVLTAPADEMKTFPLLRDRLMAVLPGGHPLGEKSVVTFKELSEWPLIRSFGTCGTLVASGFSEAGVFPGPKMIEARNLETLVALVRAGAGSAVIAELAVPSDRTGIRVVPIEPRRVREIVLSMLSFEGLSPAVEAFVEEVRSWAAQHVPEVKGEK